MVIMYSMLLKAKQITKKNLASTSIIQYVKMYKLFIHLAISM